MRIVDIWTLGANMWLVALWMKHDGATWIAVLMALLWIAGLVYINAARKSSPAARGSPKARRS